MTRERAHTAVTAEVESEATWLVELLYDELSAAEREAALARVAAEPEAAATLRAYRRIREAAARLPAYALPLGALDRPLSAAGRRVGPRGSWWAAFARWWRAKVPTPALASAVGAALVALIAVRVGLDGVAEPQLAPEPPRLEEPQVPRPEDDAPAKAVAGEGARSAGHEAQGNVATEIGGPVTHEVKPDVEHPPTGEGLAPAPRPKSTMAATRRPTGRRDLAKGGTRHGERDARRPAANGGARSVATGAKLAEPTAMGSRGEHDHESLHRRIGASLDEPFEGAGSDATRREAATGEGRVAPVDGDRLELARKTEERSVREGEAEPREARWRELRRRVAEGDLAEAERLLRIIVADEGESAESRAVADTLSRAKASRLPEKATRTGTGLE